MFGIITEHGRFTEAIFKDVEGEPEGLVKVKFNGQWGFIGKNDTFTTREDEAEYEYCMD